MFLFFLAVSGPGGSSFSRGYYTVRWAFHDHLLKLALKHMEEASQFLQGQDDGEVGEGTDDELLNAQEVK